MERNKIKKEREKNVNKNEVAQFYLAMDSTPLSVPSLASLRRCPCA